MRTRTAAATTDEDDADDDDDKDDDDDDRLLDNGGDDDDVDEADDGDGDGDDDSGGDDGDAMMAMANALDTVLLRVKPPVYTTSKARRVENHHIPRVPHIIFCVHTPCSTCVWMCVYPEVCCAFQTFADDFTSTIKQYSGPGAGIPIKTNAKGDAVVPFEVTVFMPDSACHS